MTELKGYTTQQNICLKGMFFLKLCTDDYIKQHILLEDMFLLNKNLLTDPVLLRCLLWE